MRFNRAFYSFYVLVLLALIGVCIMNYRLDRGREVGTHALNHIAIQMKIYKQNILDLGRSCLRQYTFAQCQDLSFDFDSYKAQFALQNCQDDLCVIDVFIELINPINSQLMRSHRREIWNLKNLKQSSRDGQNIDTA